MYRFSRSMYRELAPRVIDGTPGGPSPRQELLEACESTIRRLAADRGLATGPRFATTRGPSAVGPVAPGSQIGRRSDSVGRVVRGAVSDASGWSGGAAAAMMLLGVDVGGTFTDAVVFDGERLHTAKVATTPEDQSQGVMAAVDAALERGGAGRDRVQSFAHGMTVGTNALLEHRG